MRNRPLLSLVDQHQFNHLADVQLESVRAGASLLLAEAFGERGDVAELAIVDVGALREGRRRRHGEVDVVELRMLEAVVLIEVHPDVDLTIDWAGSGVVRLQRVQGRDVLDRSRFERVPRVQDDVLEYSDA